MAQSVERQLGRNREEDQDWDMDAGLPQLEGLIERGHAQAGDPIGDERPRNGHGAVAVGIGLDHRLDTSAGRKQPLQQTNIADYRVEVDLQPGGPRQEGETAAWRHLDQRMARGDDRGRLDFASRNHWRLVPSARPVSYTHLRAHETVLDLVCRLL